MLTLNQIASKGANLLNDPFNHELKERIKDSFKEIMATRLRHSVARHGLDDMLLVSYPESIVIVNQNNVVVKTPNVPNTRFRTRNPVHKPIRFDNDAPFTYVGTTNKMAPYPIRNPSESSIMHSISPIGKLASYYIENSYLFFQFHYTNPVVQTFIGYAALTNQDFNINQFQSHSFESDQNGIVISIPNVVNAMPSFLVPIELEVYSITDGSNDETITDYNVTEIDGYKVYQLSGITTVNPFSATFHYNFIPDLYIPTKTVLIESMFVDVEQVLTMYDNNDGQDVRLPFPEDIVSSIFQELMKGEFGMIMPANLEVKISDDKANPTN
jgi:hypothetical protein